MLLAMCQDFEDPESVRVLLGEWEETAEEVPGHMALDSRALLEMFVDLTSSFALLCGLFRGHRSQAVIAKVQAEMNGMVGRLESGEMSARYEALQQLLRGVLPVDLTAVDC